MAELGVIGAVVILAKIATTVVIYIIRRLFIAIRVVTPAMVVRVAQLVNILLKAPHLALLALLESTRRVQGRRIATFVLQVKLQTVQRVLFAPIAPRALI